jgi:aryl-alcohol dehydrogenase-like predicted oxidoreductase
MSDKYLFVKIALGTAQFGLNYGVANQKGQIQFSEAEKILAAARATGVDTIDTAVAYGTSEEVLGKIGVQGFRMVSKLPPFSYAFEEDIGSWASRLVRASLTHLNQSALYGLLLHRPRDFLGSDGLRLFQSLQGLKERGLVQKIGVSIYSPCELSQINKKVKVDLVQAPFNLIDRRLYTSGWLDRLNNEGIEVHTRSVFLQGLLLLEKNLIPPKFHRWMKLWTSWHDWLSCCGMSAIDACLAYPLSFQQIGRIVVGVNSLDQYLQVAKSKNQFLSLDLPDISCNDEFLINPSNWNALEARI